MKYIFAVILTLPFSIHAMDSKAALITNLNGLIEQLKNTSIEIQERNDVLNRTATKLDELLVMYASLTKIEIQERNDVLNRTATKLDELLVMYASLTKQEQDEHIRQRLAYIQQNLIESKEMLKEMLEEEKKRQNKRFWFFGAGDQDSELATGEDEQSQLNDIQNDIAVIAHTFLAPISSHVDADNDSDSCETVSVTSDQIVDELRNALLTMHVTSSNKR